MSDTLGTAQVVAAARAAWARHLGAPPDEGLRGRLAEGSLASAIHATALTVPARPALEIDGVAISHGELDARAARMAGWLRGRKILAGEAILLSAPTSIGFVVAYLGALRAGASVVLANPAYAGAELSHLLRDSAAVVALATEPALTHLRAAGPERSKLREVVDLGDLLPADAAWATECSEAPAPDPALGDGSVPAILAYTSGTTGKPKAVPLTDANLLSSIRAAMLAWRWSPDDVLVHALPLFHQHGLGGLHATLLAGSRAVIDSRFDPDRLLRQIVASRATVLFAVPSIYARLIETDRLARADLGSLRLLVSGSAPLSPRLADRIANIAGQPPIERYGTTESGLDISNPYDGSRKAGSVGLALPGLELAITGKHGDLLSPGRDGEIAVRGPQVFSGYRGDPIATDAAFYSGGWFRTGDIGRIDPADGYLRVTGRLRELIISGGMNVYPREVELVLQAHPAVAGAAVVGRPSERWGEEVVAAVVPAAPGGLGVDELLAFVRTQLAPYKCPKRIVIVSELPLNAVGKVVAADVRKLVDELAR